MSTCNALSFRVSIQRGETSSVLHTELVVKRSVASGGKCTELGDSEKVTGDDGGSASVWAEFLYSVFQGFSH